MSYPLEPGGGVTVPVAVDHGQFIACDPEAELDIDSYSKEAIRQGVALWDGGGGITVFTASHWTHTLVTVALHHARPRLHLDECDHVVEAGFSIRSRGSTPGRGDGRPGRPAARDPVGLLDERDRAPEAVRDVRSEHEIGRADAAARAVAEDERAARVAGGMQVRPRGAVQGVELEHGPQR